MATEYVGAEHGCDRCAGIVSALRARCEALKGERDEARAAAREIAGQCDEMSALGLGTDCIHGYRLESGGTR